ncbi:MAG: hypothetical protein ABR911_08395 [Syntrophales bacterium]
MDNKTKKRALADAATHQNQGTRESEEAPGKHVKDNILSRHQTTKLLLDESPLIIQPSLAARIGLEAAVVLQQIHYLLRIKQQQNRHIIDGRPWIYNSYPGWKTRYFPFFSLKTIQRIFNSLEKTGVITSQNFNSSKMDKTKWYSINYDHKIFGPDKPDHPVSGDDKVKMTSSSGQNDLIDQDKATSSNILKTTQRFTPKTNDDDSTNKDNRSGRSSGSSSDSENSEDENKKFFPQTTGDEASSIIQDVIAIEYPPSRENIRNVPSLRRHFRKLLAAGQLEIPDTWIEQQAAKQKKAIRAAAEREYLYAVEQDEAKEALKSFDELTTEQQQQYIDRVKRDAGCIDLSPTILRVAAAQYAVQEAREEGKL